MKKLIGWTLTEGRIPGEPVTRDPAIADVIAALEATHGDMLNPYVVLTAPESGEACSCFCQALACEDHTYRCEIRLFGRNYREYRHYNIMRPDEHGRIGGDEPGRPGWISGYYPDLETAAVVFTGFGSNPTALPEISGWQWLDITEEIDAIT